MAKKTARRTTSRKTTRRKAPVAHKKRPSQKRNATKLREPEWLRELRKREDPLELAIDEEGWIVAASYDFDGTHYFNLTIHHPEGNFDFGWDPLRRREKFGADTKAFRNLTYAKKKAWLLRRLERLSDYIGPDGEPPWTAGQRGMNEWLDQSDDCDYEDCGGGWVNQHMVGHPIHDALTPKERKLFGVTQGDAGGPASDGCMVTGVECSMEDLNALIRQKELPFVVVRDDRRKSTAEVAFPRLHSPAK